MIGTTGLLLMESFARESNLIRKNSKKKIESLLQNKGADFSLSTKMENCIHSRGGQKKERGGIEK